MDNILRDINAVVGVTGCLVSDAQGGVLASAMPDMYPGSALLRVGRTITQTIAGLATARRRKVVDIDLQYPDRRLVIKNLKQGSLSILCRRNMNVPLLNLTADVAVRKINRLLAGMDEKKLRKARLQAIANLKEIAQEALGANSAKATSILDAAGETDEDLAETCAKVEEITRLFIDSRKAKEIAGRMRAILQS